ncbi:MAG: conjugative transfer signal peptidase TraF [Azoarcus sp.]|jgi:conjugal transfer pilin signal peptidase TrbI|nr:conjugative transfer signal peptidase TraF [Azoarcus sp.]
MNIKTVYGSMRPRYRLRDFPGRMMRRWYLTLPLALIWALAYARIFIDPRPRVPLLFNWTPSLPYRVALMRPAKKARALQRGQFIVYAFAGEAQTFYPGLKGQPFFKIVRGLPGDAVTVKERTVFVNGEAVGVARTHTFDRRPLTPIAPTTIPPGHYYVQGISPDSFDSRYRESGLVRTGQLIGVVAPIF